MSLAWYDKHLDGAQVVMCKPARHNPICQAIVSRPALAHTSLAFTQYHSYSSSDMARGLKKHLQPVPDVPLSQQKLGYSPGRWGMASLEYGWLEDHVLNSPTLLAMLRAPKPAKTEKGYSFYQEPALLLTQEYLKAWSFRLPAESDIDFQKRHKTAVKNGRKLPVQIAEETEEAMQERLARRPQVRHTLIRPNVS